VNGGTGITLIMADDKRRWPLAAPHLPVLGEVGIPNTNGGWPIFKVLRLSGKTAASPFHCAQGRPGAPLLALLREMGISDIQGLTCTLFTK
jgi:hypothetical protein